MHALKWEDTPQFVNFGNSYSMLLPRDFAEATESALVRLEKGRYTPEHSHSEEEQVYFIIKGRGLFEMNGERIVVSKYMVLFIPRNASHRIEALSKELVYIYVAVWPGGIPANEREWKKAYKIGESNLSKSDDETQNPM